MNANETDGVAALMTEPIPTPSPDDALMLRVAEDCTASLEALMERWQSRVYCFIVRGVRDSGAAEELTQETFWRLWRARKQYQAGGKFSAWLYRIATRLCLDHHRRRARQPILVEADEDLTHLIVAPASDHADRGARESELAEILDRALGRLPLNQRLALEMNRFEAMSYREIATALDCSVGSVEQLIYRARKRLREELAGYLDETTPGVED